MRPFSTKGYLFGDTIMTLILLIAMTFIVTFLVLDKLSLSRTPIKIVGVESDHILAKSYLAEMLVLPLSSCSDFVFPEIETSSWSYADALNHLFNGKPTVTFTASSPEYAFESCDTCVKFAELLGTCTSKYFSGRNLKVSLALRDKNIPYVVTIHEDHDASDVTGTISGFDSVFLDVQRDRIIPFQKDRVLVIYSG